MNSAATIVLLLLPPLFFLLLRLLLWQSAAFRLSWEVKEFSALNDTLFFIDDLSSSTSDIINVVIPLAKYHIHFCKWKCKKPSFHCFTAEFESYKSLQKLKECKLASKNCKDTYSHEAENQVVILYLGSFM